VTAATAPVDLDEVTRPIDSEGPSADRSADRG
jgi:hypothetical protein